MAPHAERWNPETKQYEEVPGTRHGTGKVKSAGHQKTTQVLNEGPTDGYYPKEVGDGDGQACTTPDGDE